MRLKWLSLACSLIPTVVEGSVVAAMSVWLLSLPWTWAFMTGFIVAGVAPAIVVPALLSLQVSLGFPLVCPGLSSRGSAQMMKVKAVACPGGVQYEE
jgi:hypothetical protein